MKAKRAMEEIIRAVDVALDNYLPPARTRPATIHKAMRYSVFAGGKRLRPVLCLLAAEACGGQPDSALPAACAIECIHTYSLIHDDLPCMDDDDLRRGRPTSHKVFGEGIAVLAGDALLTLAFEILAQTEAPKRYPLSHQMRILAEAAGSRALIAGQVADIEGEGRPATRSSVRYIHQNKTAAMIRASVVLGAMSANAPAPILETLARFAEHLGLAFQVVDDILDVTQSSDVLGKSAGKDVQAGKATYPAVIGLNAARREARRLTRLADQCLAPLGPTRSADLQSLASRMLAREF